MADEFNIGIELDSEMIVRGQYAELIGEIREWGSTMALCITGHMLLNETGGKMPEGTDITPQEFAEQITNSQMEGMNVLYEIVQKHAVQLWGEELEFHGPDCNCENEDEHGQDEL